MSASLAPTNLSFDRAVGLEIAIYPYSGGKIFINGINAQLHDVVVQRPLRGNYATANITLGAGGVNGQEAQTWTQLVPAYSFIVIGMTVGGQSQIIFAGITTRISETQTWSQSGAERGTLIECADLAFILATSEFYALSALLAGAAQALTIPGVLSIQAPGLQAGTPAQLAQTYYSQIVCSPPSELLGTLGGVFETLQFTVGKTSSSFYNLVATLFEEWDGPALIPSAVNNLSTFEPFIAKFKLLLQEPWYETFFDIAPVGTYAGTAAKTNVPSPGKQAYPESSIAFINRLCPLPRLTNSGNLTAPKYSMNLEAWDALPIVQIGGFIQSSLAFQPDDTANFFAIQANTIGGLFGFSNDNLTSFISTQNVYLNYNSLARYGYRPSIIETLWWFDPAGIQATASVANGTQDDYSVNFQDALLRLVSIATPTPYMAIGTLTIPANPTIGIGTRLQYVPFKDNVPWLGYITGVEHSYTFGESAKTTVTLERCLPLSVYGSGDLLTALHTGNASVVDGVYQMNPKGSTAGITPITLGSLAPNNTAYSTPQGGTQPSAG